MAVTRMWLTCRQFAERYQVSYETALVLAKKGACDGHWAGEKKSRFMFNASRCDSMYESGELDRAINAL